MPEVPPPVGELLSPEFVSLLDLRLFDGIDNETIAQSRVHLPGLGTTDLVTRTDHLVPGDPPIPVRTHRAKAASGLLPCVISIHGGGFVVGGYDMDDHRFESWCTESGLMGVSVEYRLAPEVPYPGPLEDCHRALRWTIDHAEELGVDRTRIGLYGPSAGGGLAAGLALLVRDREEPPLAFQLLESPMLDDRQQSPSSTLEGLPVWSREANQFGWRSYLGDQYGSDELPYYAAPARATDLSGLPPTYVSVGAVDGFRDEDIEYAARLNRAGVPTELHVYPGAPHGYQMFVDSPVARQSQRDSDEWLARVLAG
jgi:acetyl esterase/lipase